MKPTREDFLHALESAAEFYEALAAAGTESFGRCTCGRERQECLRRLLEAEYEHRKRLEIERARRRAARRAQARAIRFGGH